MKIIFVMLSTPEGQLLLASCTRSSKSAGQMIKAPELQRQSFDEPQRTKVLLHGLTRGNVMLCTVGDPYHLKSLSFSFSYL